MPSFAGVVRRVALAGVVVLVAFLAGVLAAEGITAFRLGLFGAIAAAAVIGGAGLLRESRPVAGLAGIALLALGVWQAAIGFVVVPVGLLVLFAALVVDGSGDGLPDPSSA